MIKLQNVTVVYGKKETETCALNNVNVLFEVGKMISIMGKSGSGKTTLLKVVGGLLKPNNGECSIGGQNIYSLSEKERCLLRRRKFGFIYQAYDLVPELTAKENIVLPLLLDNKKPNMEDLNNLMDVLEISNLAKKFPTEMSGGEQQRVAIARAIIHKPSILLCDEPTGNLDNANSKRIMELIKKIQIEYSALVLLVTHDSDIAAYADLHYKMFDGRLEEVK